MLLLYAIAGKQITLILSNILQIFDKTRVMFYTEYLIIYNAVC
jgi:hypothetical protein